MEPLVRGIEVAFLHSDRGDELADWYGEHLGLERGYADDTWIEFAFEGSARFAIDVTRLPRSCVEAQPVMVCFRVDDVAEAVRVLAARGVSFYPSEEDTIFEAGPARIATFQDGAGNWMQLAEVRDPPPPHRPARPEVA